MAGRPQRLVSALARRVRQVRKVQASSSVMAPTLSVVVPAFNAQPFVTDCLRSILGQSLRDLEVIVVDDGSTDATLALVTELAAKDGRITVLTGPNEGPGAARNRGIAAASGRYLAFADADDLVAAGAYEAMVASLESSDSDFVVGGYLRVGVSGALRPRLVERLHQVDRLGVTLEEMPELLEEPVLWNKVFRREFWDANVGLIPLSRNYEDREPIYRASLAGTGIDVLDRDVYHWRLPDHRRTRSQTKGQVGDLRARFAVIRELTTLIETAPGPVRDRAFATWMGTDVAVHAQFVPSTRKEFWEVLRKGARAINRAMPAHAWTLIPAQSRLLMHAVVHGTRADVREILATRLEDTSAVPIRLVDGVLRVEPSYVPRLKIQPPAQLLLAHPADLDLVARVQRVAWESPSSVTISGYAYLPGVSVGQSVLTVVLLDGDRELSRVAAVRTTDVSLDEEIADPWNSYARAAFVARVAVPDLEHPSPVLSVAIEYQQHGVVRRSQLRLQTRRRAVWPGPVAMSVPWTVRTDGNGRLSMRSTGRSVRVSVMHVEHVGQRLVVQCVPETAHKVEHVELRSGELSVQLSRLPSSSGRVRFGGALPPLPPRYQAGGERIWDVRAVTATGESAIRCTPELASDPGIARARALVERDGSLRIEERARRVSVARVEVSANDLVIHGRCDPPTDDLTLGLCSSRATVLPRYLEMATDGTFEAAISLLSEGGAALPGGGTFLRYGLDGSAPTIWVRASRPLIDEPVDFLTTALRVRVEGRRDHSVAVMLAAPLSGVERTRVGQFRLRNAEYGPLRRAIMFEVFNGKGGAGNPAAIYKQVRALDPEIPCYWSVVDLSVTIPSGATAVVVGSAAWHEALATSAVLVNNNNFPHFMTKRAGQFFLQTWHGTPIKRLLLDLPTRRVPDTYLRLMERQVPGWDLLLAQSEEAAITLKSGLGYGGEVLVIEQPRNGRLLAGEPGRRAIRERLGIGSDESVVLYVPTWREVHRRGVSTSWDELLNPAELSHKVGAKVLVRAHHVARTAPIVADGVIDVTHLPDIEDLMLAADVLVTDYSSAAYDFERTGRPVVHFAPDIEAYGSVERGFYGDWPNSSRWPVTTTTAELTDALRRALTAPTDMQARAWQQHFGEQQHALAVRILTAATSRAGDAASLGPVRLAHNEEFSS